MFSHGFKESLRSDLELSDEPIHFRRQTGELLCSCDDLLHVRTLLLDGSRRLLGEPRDLLCRRRDVSRCARNTADAVWFSRTISAAALRVSSELAAMAFSEVRTAPTASVIFASSPTSS